MTPTALQTAPPRPAAVDPAAPPAFRVAVFAHNEERRIGAALNSILASVPRPADVRVYVLINGSTDNTLGVVEGVRREHPEVVPVVLRIADKSNAWNHYVHHLADDSPVHVFMDGDVWFPPDTLPGLRRELLASPSATAIAGVPLSGRNRHKHFMEQVRHAYVWGGLYAVKGAGVRRIKEAGVRIPVGMVGEDALLTLFVTTDLTDLRARDRARVLFHPDLGFHHQSPRLYRPADWRVYFNRLVRYRLRTLQIMELKRQGFRLARTIDGVNKQILADLDAGTFRWHERIDRFVRDRLRAMYPTPDAVFYDRLLDDVS